MSNVHSFFCKFHVFETLNNDVLMSGPQKLLYLCIFFLLRGWYPTKNTVPPIPYRWSVGWLMLLALLSEGATYLIHRVGARCICKAKVVRYLQGTTAVDAPASKFERGAKKFLKCAQSMQNMPFLCWNRQSWSNFSMSEIILGEN